MKNTEYAFNFTLYELIYPESKQLRVTPNQIEIGFHKKSRGRWQRLLREKKKVVFSKSFRVKFIGPSHLGSYVFVCRTS